MREREKQYSKIYILQSQDTCFLFKILPERSETYTSQNMNIGHFTT